MDRTGYNLTSPHMVWQDDDAQSTPTPCESPLRKTTNPSKPAFGDAGCVHHLPTATISVTSGASTTRPPTTNDTAPTLDEDDEKETAPTTLPLSSRRRHPLCDLHRIGRYRAAFGQWVTTSRSFTRDNEHAIYSPGSPSNDATTISPPRFVPAASAASLSPTPPILLRNTAYDDEESVRPGVRHRGRRQRCWQRQAET
ncbi:hypothetical protein BJ912DRAFT_1058840 [Pholiota molesta]|nr:hypothetical protein BJ912DRAFT_1058840 [Pholiota molesta]